MKFLNTSLAVALLVAPINTVKQSQSLSQVTDHNEGDQGRKHNIDLMYRDLNSRKRQLDDQNQKLTAYETKQGEQSQLINQQQAMLAYYKEVNATVAELIIELEECNAQSEDEPAAFIEHAGVGWCSSELDEEMWDGTVSEFGEKTADDCWNDCQAEFGATEPRHEFWNDGEDTWCYCQDGCPCMEDVGESSTLAPADWVPPSDCESEYDDEEEEEDEDCTSTCTQEPTTCEEVMTMSTGCAATCPEEMKNMYINSLCPAGSVLGVPGVPESLTAGSVSSSDLTFSWSPPSYDGGSPITYYYLYWDQGTGGDITTFLGETNRNTKTKTVTGLSPSTTYGFKVVARNVLDKGVGEKSDALYMTTEEEEDPCANMIAPGVPEDMTAGAVTSSSLTYSWSAPECPGSSPVDQYYLYFDQGYGGSTDIYFSATNSQTTSKTVTGLYPGWPYVFKVVARNSDGEFSEASDLLYMTTEEEATDECSATSCQSCACGSCNTCACGNFCYDYCSKNYCGCQACYGQNPNPLQ